MPEAFDVGDAVVHPHHGAGVVISSGPRRLLGAARNYLEIELALHSLTIMVPCDSASRVGPRAVMNRQRFRQILEVLEQEPEVVSDNWSARQKRLRTKLRYILDVNEAGAEAYSDVHVAGEPLSPA